MVKKVKIGGKLRPVKFGMNALRIYSDNTNSTLSDLTNISKMSITNMIMLIYVGLQEGARKEKQKFEFIIDDIADWLDDDFEIVNEIMEIFVESFPNIEKSKNLKAPKKGAKKKN